MQAITEREYTRLLSNLWWTNVAKTLPSQTKKERLIWLLETAMIERPNASRGGGQAIFEDIVSQTVEFENLNAVAGLELKKEQLEDVFNGTPGGEGLQLASHWSAQVGAYAAYWPQKMVANAIKANPTAYDGKAFFAVDHPHNPFNDGAEVFANLFAGAASGANPGALPIDETNAPNVADALKNLAKAIAETRKIKMPNGVDPRFLKVDTLIVPPALASRAQQLTNAQFIAQTAGTNAGGTGDVAAVIRNFGLGQPIVADELGAAFGGSDTTYYLGMREITGSQLGAFVYVDREPFSLVMHGEMTDAELARKRTFQWTTEGRNVVGPGHPYLLIRVDAT